jgi:DNA adenine methylase
MSEQSTLNSVSQPPNRPLLRYFGGKWMLAPWVISHFPVHSKYIEPFGGGGSILLSKSIVHAEIYNDLDSDIVNLFSVVRSQLPELLDQIRLTPYAREEFEQSYETCESPLEQARRTLVRSWMGFASGATSGFRSGFRNDSSRPHTLPVHDWASLPTAIERISNRLRNVIIENRDALAVMKQHDAPDALHYIDPPYVSESRAYGYKAVYRHEMTDEQHVGMLDEIKKLKGMVIISGYSNEIYNQALSEWTSIKRMASAGGGKEGSLPREEMLWLSPAASRALKCQKAQTGFDF